MRDDEREIMSEEREYTKREGKRERELRSVNGIPPKREGTL